MVSLEANLLELLRKETSVYPQSLVSDVESVISLRHRDPHTLQNLGNTRHCVLSFFTKQVIKFE